MKLNLDSCMEQYHGLFTTMYASYQRKYNSTSDIQFSKDIETSHFVVSKINHVNNLTNDERCFLYVRIAFEYDDQWNFNRTKPYIVIGSRQLYIIFKKATKLYKELYNF